jgi:hypothetical protein
MSALDTRHCEISDNKHIEAGNDSIQRDRPDIYSE